MRNRAVAVVVRRNKVLLVRDRGKHRFSLPGGGIRKGEPTVSAAARELYEELGLRARSVERLRHCDFRGAFNHHRVCRVEALGRPRLRGHELDRFVWWDMRDSLPLYGHVTSILRAMGRM